ncbi:TonB-dependent receptor [Horticoccus sp. 23ND18S-11]|uniref:TonB-dependent receptor n=1 Tax=Horticoccus sp. 23ND18S-11 TaxID=3391832 RepID=UPI0039C9A706
MNSLPSRSVSRAAWHRVVRCLLGSLALLVAGAALAQTPRTGTVTGTISNQATGDLLPGARIMVAGVGATAIAERGGTFNLTLPEGAHTLLVSFSGLDPASVTVTVGAGQSVVRDVQLSSAVYKMEKFSVSGVREGNALAIQAQRLSDNPKWVVATDTFGNPAANPGELIQRLPGISTDIVGSEVRTLYVRGMGAGFSSLMVDGDRVATSTGTSASRDYQIEQLGTGNLESVELIKAPQPDQDANAVAGFVNLVSRRAFDLPGRRITVTGGVLWRKRGFDEGPFKDKADNLDLFNLSYSDVFNAFGGRRNLGVAFNFNHRTSYTTQDEIGPAGVLYTALSQAYLNPGSTNPLTRIFGTGDFGYKATARNAGLSVDYKLSPDAFVFAKLTFNTNDQYQIYYRPAFGNPAATAANFTPDSTYEHSILLPHAASIGISESTPAFTKNARSYALTGGTEFKLFNRSALLSVRGNYSHADISYPGWIRAQARTPGGIGFEIDRRGQDPWYPIFRQTAGPSIFDPASYLMSTSQKQSYKSGNDLYGARADLTKTFDATVPVKIKTGVKWADDTRNPFTDFSAKTWFGADGVANSADDAMTPYADLRYRQGDGRYGPFPFMTNPEGTPAAYWKQTAADAYNSYVTSNASRAKFRETITAAYIQGSIKLGQLRVLGGVRVEETDTEGTAWVRNATASWGGNSVGGTSTDPTVVAANIGRAQRSFVRRQTATGNYRDVFPGLHFVYEPGGSVLVRASYNRAISRPPIASLIPTVTENSENNTISIGNPDLKPYNTDNFEVSAEKYFEPVGLISVGVFLKEIADYSRSITTAVGPEGIDGSGTYAGYSLTTTRNVGSARVRGIELSYQQQFSFLPGAFKGLGAFANFTYLQAEGTFGGLTTTTKLANLAPRSGNAGINYRFRGFDVRLLANWTDQKYTSTNVVDIYFEERLMLDVKLQYSINRSYDVFLDINNLTDEPPRTNVTLNGLKFFKTNQGVGFTAGVRARF